MRFVLLAVVAVMLAMPALAAPEVPLQKLELATRAGFEAAGTGGTVTFKKIGEERRLLAFSGTPAADASGARTIEVSYRLDLTKGEAPRLAVMAYEKDGGAWYKLSGQAVRTGVAASMRLSVAALLPTGFSTDASGQLEWPNVEWVWVGFVFDGPAEGQVTVSAARLTAATALPTEPARLLGADGGKWSDGHDKAVQTKLEVVPEGPGGAAALRYEFNVPASGHMYAVPTAPVAIEDAEGYKHLRLKFRGQIPQGMRLLVQLGEQGGATWYMEPPGPYAADWTEMNLPLEQFKPASWGGKDENGVLDLGRLTTISIGSHGGPVKAGAGLIMAAEIELAP